MRSVCVHRKIKMEAANGIYKKTKEQKILRSDKKKKSTNSIKTFSFGLIKMYDRDLQEFEDQDLIINGKNAS